MAKFIQICASQDDLFALDEEGDVHQYNFNTKGWVKLTPSRSTGGSTPRSGKVASRWRAIETGDSRTQ